MDTFDATEATPVSPYDSDFVPFQIIANSIHDVFNNAILTPGVMVRTFSVSASMYIFFYIPFYRLFFVRSTYFVTNKPKIQSVILSNLRRFIQAVLKFKT